MQEINLTPEEALKALKEQKEVMVKPYDDDHDNYTGITMLDFIPDETDEEILEYLKEKDSIQLWTDELVTDESPKITGECGCISEGHNKGQSVLGEMFEGMKEVFSPVEEDDEEHHGKNMYDEADRLRDIQKDREMGVIE
jgi:hypothetical protein